MDQMDQIGLTRPCASCCLRRLIPLPTKLSPDVVRRRQYDAWRGEAERLDAGAPSTARGIRLTSLGANDGSPRDVKGRCVHCAAL